MAAVTVLHYDIPEDLHRRVKSTAAIRGQTLKDFLIAALERALADDEPPRRKAAGR